MQHIDAMQARAAASVSSEQTYRTITVKLHGSNELQLSINISELRAALGLPNYNFLNEGIFHSFVPPVVESDDIDDVDHDSD